VYVTNNTPSRNFGELGYWQFIVAAVQGLTYGGAALKKHSATKKYLKSQKHTQQMTHAQQLELKQKDLASRDLLLDAKGKTELYEDQQLKKLVIITFVTIILVTVLGLGTYYYLSVEN
jgi:hypothetical protein